MVDKSSGKWWQKPKRRLSLGQGPDVTELVFPDPAGGGIPARHLSGWARWLCIAVSSLPAPAPPAAKSLASLSLRLSAYQIWLVDLLESSTPTSQPLARMSQTRLRLTDNKFFARRITSPPRYLPSISTTKSPSHPDLDPLSSSICPSP
ncbi:hypothetical protein CLAIMM_15206 [Cladophialophora immunda]|nr:hypothetical protein CLAIMM_15206 [Cladophialophora immunda]